MQIHYFQRYHQKENVATANMMLLFSRLYHYSLDKFFEFMNAIGFQSEGFDPAISFKLQDANGKSVPDATITQDSFKVVVETKLNDWFYKEQLMNHLNSFGQENSKVLATIASEPMEESRLKEINAAVAEHNRSLHTPIVHANTTFEQIVDTMQSVLESRDHEMLDLLEDYRDFCYHDGLIRLDDSWKYMKMSLASKTLDFNMTTNVYYCTIHRNNSPHGYVGLYSDKSVRAIGKIKAIVVAMGTPEDLHYECEQGELTDEMKKNYHLCESEQVAGWI